MKKPPLLSVIICTLNRSEQISNLLNILVPMIRSSTELIIVDQSSDFKTQEILNKHIKINIKYYHVKFHGLSRARNFGIKQATSNIIAFTDDDCIPKLSWLKNIINTFSKHNHAVAVFGKTLAYHPEKHMGKYYPCVFTNNKLKELNEPVLHWKEIGFGNNMAFRKEIFDKLGYFSNFLGSGSIGRSAEDAEFIIRVLNNKNTIIYNPEVVVYHNRPLSHEDYIKLNHSYICGEMACYGYYYFLGLKVGKDVVTSNINLTITKFKQTTKDLFLLKISSIIELNEFLAEFFNRVLGICIGFTLFIKRRLFLINEYAHLSRTEKIVYKNNLNDFFFIQIGANNGIQNDPIHSYVKKYNWSGVLVEPIEYLYECLKHNYCDIRSNLFFENSAIYTKKCTKVMYRLAVNIDTNNPDWYQGLATFNRKVINKKEHRSIIPNFDNRLIKERVNCVTFASLIKKYHVKKIDYLVIDTEGYDFEIIKQIDFNNFKPRMILYEHKHLSNKDQTSCKYRLLNNGYKLITQEYDTFAYIK